MRKFVDFTLTCVLKSRIFRACDVYTEAFVPTPVAMFPVCPQWRSTKSRNRESGNQKPELSTIHGKNYNNLPPPWTLCYNPHTQVFNSEETVKWIWPCYSGYKDLSMVMASSS